MDDALTGGYRFAWPLTRQKAKSMALGWHLPSLLPATTTEQSLVGSHLAVWSGTLAVWSGTLAAWSRATLPSA